MSSRRVPSSASEPIAQTLVQGASLTGQRCYCGSPIEKGDLAWLVVPTSAALHPLTAGRSFCSLRCLRAFLLESIEMTDALDRPAAYEFVTGLPEMHSELRQLYARAVSLGAEGTRI